MEFNPNNKIIQLCVQGIGFEEKGMSHEASKIFLQAWDESTDDFEKFISVSARILFNRILGYIASKRRFFINYILYREDAILKQLNRAFSVDQT